MGPQAVMEEESHLGHWDQEEEGGSEVSPGCGSSLLVGNLLGGDQIQMCEGMQFGGKAFGWLKSLISHPTASVLE